MKVAVFGLGYVGTVTAACVARQGHDVWGVDVDADKVRTVAGGESPVVEPGLQELIASAVQAGSLHATTDMRVALDLADIAIVSSTEPEVVAAVRATPPALVIDLDGRLDLAG